MTSMQLAASTAERTSTDATKPLPVVVNVDARRSVETWRRVAVQRRRRTPSDRVPNTVAGPRTSAGRVGGGTELAEGAAVADWTAAGELIQAVDTESAVQARSAQHLTVVDVDVAPSSGVAGHADASVAATFIDTATYTRARMSKITNDGLNPVWHVHDCLLSIWQQWASKG